MNNNWTPTLKFGDLQFNLYYDKTLEIVDGQAVCFHLTQSQTADFLKWIDSRSKDVKDSTDLPPIKGWRYLNVGEVVEKGDYATAITNYNTTRARDNWAGPDKAGNICGWLNPIYTWINKEVPPNCALVFIRRTKNKTK